MRRRLLLLLSPLLPLCACGRAPMPNYVYWQPGHGKTYVSPEQALLKSGYQPDLIDGSYQGVASLTSAPNLNGVTWWRHPHVPDVVCPRTSYGVVEIDSGLLTYAYAPDVIFTATVAADGTLRDTVGDATLYGQVKHGHLSFAVVTPVCTTRFSGSYSGNHSY